MAKRIRRAPGKPRTAIASYIVRRADEEKRRHPEKSYATIARELGVTQKDPARFLRKLRSGETSGRATLPKLLRPTGQERGSFVVVYRWWYDANPRQRYYARVDIRAPRSSPLDVFRLENDPRVATAIERDLARKTALGTRTREGSLPSAGGGPYSWELERVIPAAILRKPPLYITGPIAA